MYTWFGSQILKSFLAVEKQTIVYNFADCLPQSVELEIARMLIRDLITTTQMQHQQG